MMSERQHYLFQRYFEKLATPEEAAELMSWLAENASDQEVLSLMDGTWESFVPTQPVFDEEKSNRMLLYALQAPVEKQRMKYWRSWAAAAAILLLLLSSGYLLMKKTSPAVHHHQLAKLKNDITPANGNVVLTLANGASIVLDDAANGHLASQGGSSIIKQNGRLLYAVAGKSGTTTIYNTISTARGKQYMVILSDSTKVWLNATSSLRYPAVFDDTIRKVELSGEAYFEVAHNRKAPFIVATVAPAGGRSAEVRVLGTHFNVKAYKDESLVKTTLLEGSVRMSTIKDATTKTRISALLAPGQQAQLSHLSGEDDHNIHLVKEVNVHQILAWKNDLFDFENETIQDIMRQLTRWYDIEVEFKGDIPEKHYYGAIRRQVNISEVFKMLEIAGNVTFTINGKKVYVQKK